MRDKGNDIIERLLGKLISEEEADILYPPHAGEVGNVYGYLHDQPAYKDNPNNADAPTFLKLQPIFSQDTDTILAILVASGAEFT
jgi:hypothetical protein